jgi:hypothetical protein
MLNLYNYYNELYENRRNFNPTENNKHATWFNEFQTYINLNMYSEDYEDYSLLKYEAVKSGRRLPTFLRFAVPFFTVM